MRAVRQGRQGRSARKGTNGQRLADARDAIERGAFTLRDLARWLRDTEFQQRRVGGRR